MTIPLLSTPPSGKPTLEPSRLPGKKQFRIKLLATAALMGFGISLAMASIVTISLATMGIVPLAVAIGTGAACATIGVIALWRKITPILPEPLKATSQLLQSIANSALAAITLGLIFPINLEKYDRKEKGTVNDIPVLFIHGFLGSSNNWIYFKRRLEEVGHENIFTINLGNPLLSIKEYALKVREKVKEIQTLTGRNDIMLVCHSMGGLVAREFLYHNPVDTVRVRKIITLGTPLAGTKIAKLASWISKAAKEMVPDSEMIRELRNKAMLDKSTHYQHVGSKVDCVILPRQSATESQREMQLTKNVELEATGHMGYLFSDAAADIVVNEVQKTEREDHPNLTAPIPN